MPEGCEMTGDTIIRDERSAIEYDEQARRTKWFGPEVVFGLAYEFVAPGDSLVDLGIGSGLSSVLFHRAGLRIHGLDGSSEVLRVCAAKGFTEGLRQHDLRDLPLPYTDRFCDHVTAVAVLNSFRDLDGLFAETARMMRPGGVFAFTVEEQRPGQEESYAINREAVNEQARAETAVTLYRHGRGRVAESLERGGFQPLKELEFLAFEYPAEGRGVYFKAHVARRLT